MIFSLGNLLTLGIVLLVLVAYRQLDKNNRSLDKVKRYADKIKEQLDLFVENKTQEVRNLAIELDVNQKTSREVLKRINSEVEGLSSHSEEMQKLNSKISEYEKVLDNLQSLTGRVEENLKRIQSESVFVDTVGKRIRETQVSINQIERNIPGLTQEFAKLNQEQLKAVTSQVKKHTEEEVSSITGLLTKTQGVVGELGQHVRELQSERDQITDQVKESFERLQRETEEGLKERKNKITEVFGREVMEILHQAREQARGISSDITKEREGLAQDLIQAEEKLRVKFQGFDEEVKDLEENYRETLENLAREGQELSGEIFGNIQAVIRDQAADTEKNLRKMLQDLEYEITASRDDISRGYEESKAEFGSWKESLEGELVESRTRFTHEYDVFAQDMKVRMDLFNTERIKGQEDGRREFSQMLSQIQENLTHLEEETSKRLEALRGIISEKEEGFKKRFENLEEENKNRILFLQTEVDNSINTFSKSLEKDLEELDHRIREFEGEVSYRFGAVEGISTEIENLEKNLKTSMEVVSKNIHRDYQNFAVLLRQERAREREKADQEIQSLHQMMEALEKDLNELKSRAYDNVSERLQVFEDEFFSDLKERSKVMETNISSWQKDVQQKMEEDRQEQSLQREALEKRYTDEMKNKITELQNRIYGQYDKFEGQIAGYQERLQERMNLSSESLKGFEEELKKEVVDIKEQSRLYFEKEFTEHTAQISGLLKKQERELDFDLKALEEKLAAGNKELSALLESSRSDVTIWQAEVLQKFRQSETQVMETVSLFKNHVSDTIEGLKSNFENQRESLIDATQEERTRLKNEIKDLGDGVADLENQLRIRTENALEAFSREWDTASGDFQKKIKDLALEADQRMKDYRLSVKETQDKIEALQKRLFGRIEEEYKLLSVNLQEIDKRQKSFVDQTKIFDRADSLKLSLESQIEDLKTEIVRVDAQSKELKEIERKFLQIKKLGEEVSSKLSRFIAEKRRIEEMEGDFKKLINISSAVDVKLDQVTSSHDTLQSIQARIRNLEEMEKEVLSRYDRLEHKKEILDSTLEGVDKNFQHLQTLEVGIKEIEESLSVIPSTIREVASQIEGLSRGKDKADAAMKMIEGLDSLLEDLEERTDKLQKAREWLARTETRLEEINKQAQEQVKLLGSLLKEGAGSGDKRDKGAPPMNVREMVVRLARQGWSVNEIAQATKISKGEVELILELGVK